MKVLALILFVALYVSADLLDYKPSMFVENFKGLINEQMTFKITKLMERMKELFKRRTVDKVEPRGDSIAEINMRSENAGALFQGDIILSREQQDQITADISGARSKRQVYHDKDYPGHRWSKGVPYVTYLSEKAKNVFKKAVQLWMDDTCIDFKEYPDPMDPKSKGHYPPRDFLIVSGGYECSSKVGKEGEGPQHLTLGNGCESIGIAAHEIGHTLGLFHTQARHDRDKYVTVDDENIQPCSAINKTRPIIVPIDVNYTETLGSDIIGFYDLLMINTYYNCSDACKNEPTPKCLNDGFAHPRNCSSCICPGGYGGQFCGERPPGCGEELMAKQDQWTSLVNELDGAEAANQRDGYMRCNYWIRVPGNVNNAKIEVKVAELPDGYAVDGCIYAGVEIKTHPDQRLTGYRFCSQADVNTVLTSNSSIVPVITYNGRENVTSTKLEYRYVLRDE